MKLVLNGYAGAGTITSAATTITTAPGPAARPANFKAGQMIGAVLEYAQRVGSPVMIYVFSDGSLSATSSIDSSTAGRGKLGWQGDNQDTASTFFLVYSPKGRRSCSRRGEPTDWLLHRRRLGRDDFESGSERREPARAGGHPQLHGTPRNQQSVLDAACRCRGWVRRRHRPH